MGKKSKTTSWRDFSIAAYAAPTDAKIYGIYDVDVSNIMEYIQKRRVEGVRLTITHFLTAAVARSMYEDVPDINCYVRRGKIVYRQNADVCISVSIEGGKGMSAAVVKKAQELSASQIAEFLTSAAERKRRGEEAGAFAAKDVIARIPWPFRRPLFRLVKWWIFDLGFTFPFLKIPPDPFGSVMITNIGTHYLAYGMVALFPIGKLPGVVTMGRITEKPVVIDGEIKIRPMLPLTGTFDHRIVDGAQIGVITRRVMERLQDPEALDQPYHPPPNPFFS
jgi:pyruvate dehydrogenase E2 component (dihydrolipoamide acetyltransferase)